MKNNDHDFKIGDKVKFIKNNELYVGLPQVKVPKIGQIYTIRDYSQPGGFLLEEIVNELMRWSDYSLCEPGFARWRFEKTIPILNGLKLNFNINEVSKKETISIEQLF